jgi:hypothetical protein
LSFERIGSACWAHSTRLWRVVGAVLAGAAGWAAGAAAGVPSVARAREGTRDVGTHRMCRAHGVGALVDVVADVGGRVEHKTGRT